MPSSEPASAEPPSAPRPSNGSLVYRYVRRGLVALGGGTVLFVGIAMTVLPGPAVVVIPLGLGILAAEFAWARNLLKRFKKGGEQVVPEWLRKYFRAVGRRGRAKQRAIAREARGDAERP